MLGAGVLMVASTYGLARYTYGLFVPVFKVEFGLSQATIGWIGSMSYVGYLLATLLSAVLSRHVGARWSIVVGGLAASVGMTMIALAESPLVLMAGVTLAGCSPGLAYPPIADTIKQFCAAEKQNRLYAIINSGTGFGIMISGPLALIAGSTWRLAWLFFAIVALCATIWNLYVLPTERNISVLQLSPNAVSFSKDSAFCILRSKFQDASVRRLFASALLFGGITSVYWIFSVDLITKCMGSTSFTGAVFWIVVGLAGTVGAGGGDLVTRYGLRRTLGWSIIAIALSIALPASPGLAGPVAAFISAIVFGASFILITALYGIWSISCFQDAPSLGFGLTFFLISAGQLFSPPVAGFLAESWRLSAVFQLAAAFCLLLFIVLPVKDVHRM